MTPPTRPVTDLRPVLVGDPWGYSKTTRPDGTVVVRERPLTEKIVIHHTAFDPIEGRTYAQEWERTAQYHVVTRGWRSIGYHRGVAPDGSRYILANDLAVTPGIWGRNHRYVYVCLLGNFTMREPTPEQIAGVLDEIADLRRIFGHIPVSAHRLEALQGHGTACPGSTYESWLPLLAA